MDGVGCSGDVRVVNMPGKGPTVFQWNAEKANWDEVGQAIGKSQKKKLGDKVKQTRTETIQERG